MKALTILVSAIEERDPDEIFDQEGALFVATVGRKVTVRTVSDPELAIKLLNKAEKASRGRSSACRSASWTRI
jgi:hypothetical protein